MAPLVKLKCQSEDIVDFVCL